MGIFFHFVCLIIPVIYLCINHTTGEKMKLNSLLTQSIFILFTTLLLLAFTSESANNQTTEEKELADITYAIDNCIGWFKTKNVDLLLSIVASDSNFLEVHPSDNVVKGRAEFEKAIPVFMNDKFQYVRHEIKDLKITVSESGTVAWFYCRLYDINTWDGQPASWENARWTGVLEKRDDRWQMVQQHFSFPQNN